MKQAHALQIHSITPQGTDAVLLSLLPKASEADAFDFLPGQYLTLEGGPENNRQWRCYSIANAPQPGRPIDVLVRRVAQGLVSNWVCDELHAGDIVKVLPPAGRFQLRQPGKSVQMFAGGSGIAPIISLARQALETSTTEITLFYANRNRATAMLLDSLETLAKLYPERLKIHYWYDDESGLPPTNVLKQLAAEGGDTYVCGPELFMNAVVAISQDCGIDASRIYLESFSATDNDGNDADPAKQASLEVTIAGATHELKVAGNDTLLASMIGAGLQVPYACRVGECASCMCKLESGSVERMENEVLDADDEQEGWILACRTRACNEKIVIRFP